MSKILKQAIKTIVLNSPDGHDTYEFTAKVIEMHPVDDILYLDALNSIDGISDYLPAGSPEVAGIDAITIQEMQLYNSVYVNTDRADTAEAAVKHFRKFFLTEG